MAKLTKYEKETIILFNEGEDTASIYTYNAGLRKRLANFGKKHPDLCRLEKFCEQGGVSYVLDKSRLSIRLQPPMSEERRRKASEYAKQNGFHAKANTMMMSMNEKKILFTFGCPKRELTVERLRHAAALAVDPTAKKAFFSLAVKLYEDATDEQYRNFYYNMRLDMERMPHHKYVPDSQPVPVDMSIRDYRKSVKERIREQQMRSRRTMK